MSGVSLPRGALFVDRDGTLIADAHYLADASRVQLIAGAADAVAMANQAPMPVIVVTNQSGIGRGMITEAQYAAVRDRTVQLFAARGAHIDATMHCPHAPTDGCICRKPGVGMYRDAAAQFDVDLTKSAYIGDRWRDVQPAIGLGGLGVLVPGIETPEEDVERAREQFGPQVTIAATLSEAVMHVLAARANP